MLIAFYDKKLATDSRSEWNGQVHTWSVAHFKFIYQKEQPAEYPFILLYFYSFHFPKHFFPQNRSLFQGKCHISIS
jgi:hypothetical protein